MKPAILLSFDVEEFDMPLEYGFQIDPVRQLEIGHDGLQRIMPFLSLPHIQTTLFTTAHFAGHYPGIIRSLSERHEIASHTWHHSRFETADLLSARLRLEEITGAPVNGLRMEYTTRLRDPSAADRDPNQRQFPASLDLFENASSPGTR